MLARCPISQKDAFAFIDAVHRHHRPPRGFKFAIGLMSDARLCGVVCVGRPVARLSDDGFTAEVTRLCTDGTENACSALYGAACRAAKAMGYRRIITYVLETEPGVSLRAAGFELDAVTAGGSWDRPSRSRVDDHPTIPKARYVRRLAA